MDNLKTFKTTDWRIDIEALLSNPELYMYPQGIVREKQEAQRMINKCMSDILEDMAKHGNPCNLVPEHLFYKKPSLWYRLKSWLKRRF